MKISLISATGHPKNPKGWSGTTLNIYNGLESAGRLGDTYIVGHNNLAFKVVKRLLDYYYNYRFRSGKSQMMMSFRFTWLRYLFSKSSSLYVKNSTVKHALHFGTITLPFIKKRAGEFHYCYIDATWAIWQLNSTNINVIKPEDQQVIEELEIKSFNSVDHIFSISDYVKRNLVEHYKIPKSKITVVGTGTGIIKPYFGEKDYTNQKILFVAKGRFEDKGGDLVLKAFHLLLEKYPDLQLSIVGQTDYSAIPSHPNIQTHGFIPIEDLQAMFNTHSLFLMPALNEPWGLVYIEAMLCRMPIVGINRNSFPELSLHGKVGVGIERPDHQQLAKAIDSLLAKPAEMAAMGAAAQKHALEQYTWDNVVAKMAAVVDQSLM